MNTIELLRMNTIELWACSCATTYKGMPVGVDTNKLTSTTLAWYANIWSG